jgi:hypothetical protein
MLDPNSFDARWTLLIGVPVIAWLSVIAWRRTQAVVRRIRDVRVEMARHPQDPYQALAALMSEEETQKETRRKEVKRAGRH